MKGVPLLTSITEEPQGGGVMRISIGGDPAGRAMVEAVCANWPRAERKEFDELAAAREKVTVIKRGENMFGAPSIVGYEGRFFQGSAYEGGVKVVGFLPKGNSTRGFQMQPSSVLDVFAGWDIERARSRVAAIEGQLPKIKPLNKARLLDLPDDRDGDSAACSMAVFGTWRMPDCVSHDAVWLLSDYDRENEIVNGVLLIRPEHGISEHGSLYLSQLLDMGGEVVDFQPVTFAEAIAMEDWSHERILDRVRGEVSV